MNSQRRGTQPFGKGRFINMPLDQTYDLLTESDAAARRRRPFVFRNSTTSRSRNSGSVTA